MCSGDYIWFWPVSLGKVVERTPKRKRRRECALLSDGATRKAGTTPKSSTIIAFGTDYNQLLEKTEEFDYIRNSSPPLAFQHCQAPSTMRLVHPRCINVSKHNVSFWPMSSQRPQSYVHRILTKLEWLPALSFRFLHCLQKEAPMTKENRMNHSQTFFYTECYSWKSINDAKTSNEWTFP